jgi:hydroxymethylbilane synthase
MELTLSMKRFVSASLNISVGARASPLSRAQVREIFESLQIDHPEIFFNPLWTVTTGDRDLKSSLRTLGKSDFFTKEIDEMLLRGWCRVAIHSAKDLPDPLREGLTIAALTKGVDPRDALVFREGLKNLPQGALVGVSCERRERAIQMLRADLRCREIRGTIENRLQQLDRGEFDAVVMAEAALIRLQLTERYRLYLNGERAPLQGQLAVVIRENDQEMMELFSCLDIRQKRSSI